MSANPQLIVLNNRLIAYLDVLGFANRMQVESAFEVVAQYSQFIKKADEEVFNPVDKLKDGSKVSNFAQAKFVFDSIVLVSHPIGDPGNVSKFIFATILLMELGFCRRLPLRGAISLGDYLETADHAVFVSPAFKRLFSEEQKLKFSGCCLLKEAETYVLTSVFGASFQFNTPAESQHPLVLYDAPSSNHEAGTKRWFVNWVHLLTPKELSNGLSYLIEPKLKNTQEFVNHIVQLPKNSRQLIQGHAPPLYFRFMPSTTQCRIRFTDEADISTDIQQGISFELSAEL